jgi:homoserine O-acetyltransferase
MKLRQQLRKYAAVNFRGGRILLSLAALCCLLSAPPRAICQGLQFADLGEFKLQSGEVIHNCRIGYRTFGTLNDRRSNAILFPTWAGGTTEQLAQNIGPGKLADTNLYYVVAVDAFSNGVSSSPSNSPLQPRMKFPKVTIGDMVSAQHELLTKVLRLTHVKAVMGMSMGGMQTFQWMVAYPDFMDQAIPIVGSPRLAPFDLLLWQTQIDAIMNDRNWNAGEHSSNPARAANAEFGDLFLTTPEHYNRSTTREQVLESIEKASSKASGDVSDKIRQCQAMMQLDVSLPFSGSLPRAAAAVKARTLVIVSKFDHVVTPGPATEFARLLGSELLVLDDDCGHLATVCSGEKVRLAVADFLGGNKEGAKAK